MMSTNRLFKTHKIIHFPSQTVTADAQLNLADGSHMADLSDVNWDTLSIETNVTAITGTNFNLEATTTNDPDFDGSDTLTENILALKADNSTALDTGNLSATGRAMVTTGKVAADGATAAKIGKKIGLFVDFNATSVTLEAWIYVQSKA